MQFKKENWKLSFPMIYPGKSPPPTIPPPTPVNPLENYPQIHPLEPVCCYLARMRYGHDEYQNLANFLFLTTRYIHQVFFSGVWRCENSKTRLNISVCCTVYQFLTFFFRVMLICGDIRPVKKTWVELGEQCLFVSGMSLCKWLEVS